MSLKISERNIDDVTILDLDGRITLGNNSGSFRDAVRSLTAKGKRKIILNFSNVGYIDSSGLGEVFSALTTVKNSGGSLRFINLPWKIRALLQMTKLYGVCDVFDSEETAIRSFRPGLRYCHCPFCLRRTTPPSSDFRGRWDEQSCPACNCKFMAVCWPESSPEAFVTHVQIQTYPDEYLEVVPGSPDTVRVQGRLNLFSSFALKKIWQAMPRARRIAFVLDQNTEIDTGGLDALLTMIGDRGEDEDAAISVEGLLATPAFPSGARVYPEKAAALAAVRKGTRTATLRVPIAESS